MGVEKAKATGVRSCLDAAVTPNENKNTVTSPPRNHNHPPPCELSRTKEKIPYPVTSPPCEGQLPHSSDAKSPSEVPLDTAKGDVVTSQTSIEVKATSSEGKRHQNSFGHKGKGELLSDEGERRMSSPSSEKKRLPMKDEEGEEALVEDNGNEPSSSSATTTAIYSKESKSTHVASSSRSDKASSLSSSSSGKKVTDDASSIASSSPSPSSNKVKSDSNASATKKEESEETKRGKEPPLSPSSSPPQVKTKPPPPPPPQQQQPNTKGNKTETQDKDKNKRASRTAPAANKESSLSFPVTSSSSEREKRQCKAAVPHKVNEEVLVVREGQEARNQGPQALDEAGAAGGGAAGGQVKREAVPVVIRVKQSDGQIVTLRLMVSSSSSSRN